MFSLFKWQKIDFQTSQFNHFAFCCKSMTSSGHDVVKVFFFTCPTDPIWVWVQRIPSFFLYYCKQKFYNHFCKAWGFMLQNQGNMPWWTCPRNPGLPARAPPPPGWGWSPSRSGGWHKLAPAVQIQPVCIVKTLTSLLAKRRGMASSLELKISRGCAEFRT